MTNSIATHTGAYTVDLATLRRAVSQALNEPFMLDVPLGYIAATGGTTTTVVCSTLSTLYTSDDEAEDGWVYVILGGAQAGGYERRIVSYNNSTFTFTIAPALPTAVQAGDIFEIHHRCTATKKARAINRAIRDGWDDFFTWKTRDLVMCNNEPYITTQTNLPTDVRRVVSLELEPLYDAVTSITATSGSTTTFVVTGTPWSVNQFAGYVLAISNGTGKGQQTEVASNTSNTLTFTNALAVAPASGSIGKLKSLPEYAEWQPLSLDEWRPYGAPYLQYMRIPHRWQGQDGRAIRMNYMTDLSELTLGTEAGTTIIPEEYLVYSACSIIALEWGFDSPMQSWDAQQWLGRWNGEERERLRQKWSFKPAVMPPAQADAPQQKEGE